MVNSDLCDHSRWLSIRFFPFREVRRNWSTDLTPSIFITEKAGQRIERRLSSGRYCWNTVSVEGSAGDVLFQVIDRRCLGRNEPFDQVTDRENSDHLSSFHNRQMPHPLFGHDSHAIDHRNARLYGYEVPSHYLLHASLL